MMDARMKEALERTKKTLCRHLEDLNDGVEQDGGRIKDHMVVDGMKDCVKTIRCIGEMMSEDAEHENGAAAAKVAPVSLK